MEIKINGKEVKIQNKDNFEYDGVSSDKLKELNEVLYKEISEKVAYYIVNKEKIEKEQAEKEETEMKIQQVKIQQEFKKEILNTNAKIKNYELKFNEPTGESYFTAKSVSISLGNTNVELSYDSTAYSSGAYHSHKTDRVWCLEADYKKRRYTKLSNALNKDIEAIDNMIASNNTRAEKEHNENLAKDEMKKFAESNGFEYEEKYHGSHNHRYSRSYNTYHMKKGNVEADIVYNTETKKVVITSYKVSRKNITLEQVKEVQ